MKQHWGDDDVGRMQKNVVAKIFDLLETKHLICSRNKIII